MQDNKFKGLRGVASDELLLRQQRDVQETFYNRMEDVVDACRQHVVTLYQQGKELSGASLEAELVRFLLNNHPKLPLSDRTQVARVIRDELEGYGPLQRLMSIDEKTITDIVVIKPDKIVYEQNGALFAAREKFRSEAQLRIFIEGLCYRGKRKVDESNPSVSLTLPEGLRVAISIPPLSGSAHLAIRKFNYVGSIDGLVPETYSKEGALFLKKATKGRLNIVFTGPMGTGKTTMIAVLGHEFYEMELPVLVQEIAECPLEHPYLRSYTARPANIEGRGEISFGYILKHALQSRATRILVAEVRDGAIFYMLRGMATGQSGMGTLHAENPSHAVQAQIPMMLGQAPEASGMDQGSRNMIISAALDLIVQLAKEYDPVTRREKRVCTHISEVQLSAGEAVEVKDIFVRQNGEMVPTGYAPKRALEKMARQRVAVPLEIFRKGVR